MSTQEVGDIFGEGKGPAQAMLRSPTVLIVSVGLWGMNVFLFRLFGINYRYVLNYDLMQEARLLHEEDMNHDGASSNDTIDSLDSDKNRLDEDDEEAHALLFESHQKGSLAESASTSSVTWLKLVLFSIVLLNLLTLTTYVWMDVLERGVIGAVLCFYSSILIYIFLPISSNRWLRQAFSIVLERTAALFYPRCWYCRPTVDSIGKPIIPRAIPFVDVFFADAMCSLSKVFFDWGMLLHMASHYPEPVPADAHNILIPSFFAAVPFLIRARQCLLMYSICRIKNDPKKYEHVANAIKYSTSIWPLMVSAYIKTLGDAKEAKSLEGLLILLQIINACYALYWDIVKDWGMMQNPQAVVAHACSATSVPGLVPLPSPPQSTSCHHLVLRPRLRYGWKISVLILLTDSLLRFSWALRFVDWFVSHDALVLVTQFLEVLRRALWNLLRVEWENIKQKSKQLKARDSMSDNEDEDDHPMTMASTNGEQELATRNSAILMGATMSKSGGVLPRDVVGTMPTKR
eukprot:Nitzschia sp. Nitz4//scaffold431_size8127//2380//4024//NITZ4_009139-RA/size8127-snap-gene-0.8-mRNA-1//-1//CDS//3329551801//4003//frame0